MTDRPKLPSISIWLWFDHETFRQLREFSQTSGVPIDMALNRALNEFGQFSDGQVYPGKQGVQYSLTVDAQTHEKIRQKAFDAGQSIQAIALAAIQQYLQSQKI